MSGSSKSVTASKPGHDGNAAVSSALRAIVLHDRSIAPRTEILRQGETPKFAHVVLSGYMCRYRMLADGRRQITAVLLPGDICDTEAVLTGKASYGISALTAGEVGAIPIGSLQDIDGLASELRQILWRQILRDAAISREWILSLGRRNSLERIAHLFCELWTRLRFVGLADVDGCKLQVTQSELGDILGLSSVHVNRTLQELRATGLIQFMNGTLRIFDHAALAKLAGFNPSYLSLPYPGLLDLSHCRSTIPAW